MVEHVKQPTGMTGGLKVGWFSVGLGPRSLTRKLHTTNGGGGGAYDGYSIKLWYEKIQKKSGEIVELPYPSRGRRLLGRRYSFT